MRAVGARGVVQMPQFNGKQGGELVKSLPNLRCPRNGKWTNRKILLPSRPLGVLATFGKAMAVDSISPDTGQHGGCTLEQVCSRDAQALSGTTARAP